MDSNTERAQATQASTAAKRGAGSIYKRGNTWWCRYSHHGHEVRMSAKTDSERKALAFLKEKIKATGNPDWVDPSQPRRRTFEDLAKALREDYTRRKRRSADRLEYSIKHLETYFGLDRVSDITKDRIHAYQAQRQKEDAADGTINREIAALTHGLRCLGLTPPKFTKLKEADPRRGFLEYEEWLKLRDALPQYLRDPVGFLYFSGWRLREMTGLEWIDVRLASETIELPPPKAKNDEARKLPYHGTELADIMARAVAARHKDCEFVFHHDGREIKSFRGAWAKACDAALGREMLVHDLRRCTVRDHSRGGTPDTVTMKLTGHKTREVFDRYNITSDADLTAAMQRREAYHAAQIAPKPQPPKPKLKVVPKRTASAR